MTMQTEPIVQSAGSQEQERAGEKPNVGATERALSSVAGSYCLLRGLTRGNLSGLAMACAGAGLLWRAASGHCGVYQKLGIDTAASPEPGAQAFYERGVHVSVAYLVDKPAEELFRFWRNFENLPGFMDHLQEVTVIDEVRSHWKAKAPAGMSVEWDAEIINEEPNRLIAWKSVDGADVHSTGSVRFVETGSRGTEVRVVLSYIPPAGQLGRALARLWGEAPEQQIREDVRRFKRLMETGEIAISDGQSRGTCAAGCDSQEMP